MEFKPGFIPSPRDDRDYKFKQYNSIHGLPSKFERSVPFLKDQKRLGACVGFASSYIKDEHEHRNHPGRRYETSPLYVYAECKKQDGMPNIEGTYIRVANKVVQKQGICLEKTYPYTDKQPIREVPQAAHEEAKEFKIRHYLAVENAHEIKQAIHDHGDVHIGVMVLSSFLDPEIKEGKAFVRFPQMFILGGHAMAVVGYDDNLEHVYEDGRRYKGFIKIVNSWYDEANEKWWGVDGFAWIPYEMLFQDITSDMPGFKLFAEAWCWQDEITPAKKAQKIEMWLDKEEAYVDGEKVLLQQAPKSDPDSWRTLTPLRQTCELLGLDVEWIASERKILIRDGDRLITLWIGSRTAVVDGKTIFLEQPPVVDPDSWRTLIPLRFVSEVMGFSIQWDEKQRKITIRRSHVSGGSGNGSDIGFHTRLGKFVKSVIEKLIGFVFRYDTV